MPNQTGGIDVGDAVMTFLADTTQIDSALARMEADTRNKLEPANEAIQEVAGNWQFTGQAASTAAAESDAAADRMVVDAEKVAEAQGVSTEAVRATTEAIGLKLPRAMQSVLTKIPELSSALQLAFDASVVFFMVEAVVQIAEKLSNFIATTFIYTQAMKDADKETAAMNVELLKQADAFKKSQTAMAEFGLTGSTLTKQKMAELTVEIQKNEKALNDAQNVIGYYNRGLGGTAEASQKAEVTVLEMTATLKAQSEQLALFQKQMEQEQTNEIVEGEKNKITAWKTAQDGFIKLQEQQARLNLAHVKGDWVQQAQATAEGENTVYRVEMEALQRQLSLTQFEGEKGILERRTILAQIEALESEHKAKLLQNYNDMMERIKAAVATPIPLITSPIPDTIVTADTQAFDRIAAAAAKLGVTTSVQLGERIEEMKAAYKSLADSGVASVGDLLAAHIRLLNLQIQYKQSLGEDASLEQKMLAGLTKQYNDMYGIVDRTARRERDFFRQFILDLHNGVNVMQQFKNIGGQAFNDLALNMQNAFQQAILGQKGFVQALEEATASALASIAAQALVKAIFYTAEGFAALASFDGTSAGLYFKAAAEMGAVGAIAGIAAHELSAASGGNKQQGGTTSGTANSAFSNNPAAQAQQPTQQVNVAHLASGGLVTSETLAIVGEHSRREAVIPLESGTALDEIAAKLAARIGHGGGMTVHVDGLISPDNLTKVMQQMSRRVNAGKAKLVSSDSRRLTRRTP